MRLKLQAGYDQGIMNPGGAKKLLEDLVEVLSQDFSPQEISKQYPRKRFMHRQNTYEFTINAQKPFLKIAILLRDIKLAVNSKLVINVDFDPLAAFAYCFQDPWNVKALEALGETSGEPIDMMHYLMEHPTTVLNYYLHNIFTIANSSKYGRSYD